VTVSVKDDGLGVALEDQERIFDKFQQVHSAASSKMGGTGLGLSICKAIIEQHNGQIGVESTLGRGSRFFFMLPAVQANGASATPEPEIRQVTAAGTRGAVWGAPLVSERPPTPFILMVDDDPGLRKVVARIVQHSGHHVETADNGEEAIEKINALRPDLVILDVLMPVLSGFGVVQALRRQPATRGIPLLVLTTKDLSEAEKDALRLGPTKFMTKSLVTVESLTAAMNELLQHRREPAEVFV
jgi:CheY-like chemotaxis protein